MATPHDAARAEAIRSHISRADDHLRAALCELRDAHHLAKDDFPHNDEKLAEIVTLTSVTSSLNIQECYKWRDYATARRGF